MRIVLALILATTLAGCATPEPGTAQKKTAPSATDKQMEEGEVASLDTRDNRYAVYFAHVKRKIRGEWDPRSSKYSGNVKLKFVLRADGTLRRVELLSSSGYRILDDAALNAISEAAPFKPFPHALKSKRKFLPIAVHFNYEVR